MNLLLHNARVSEPSPHPLPDHKSATIKWKWKIAAEINKERKFCSEKAAVQWKSCCCFRIPAREGEEKCLREEFICVQNNDDVFMCDQVNYENVKRKKMSLELVMLFVRKCLASISLHQLDN